MSQNAKIKIQVDDQATKKILEIANTIDTKLKNSSFNKIRMASVPLDPIFRDLDKLANKFRNITAGLVIGVGTPLAAFTKASMNVFANHQESMAQLKVLNNASDDTINQTEKVGRDIAGRSVFSISDVAKTMVDLNKQGVELPVLPVMTERVLDFATAGQFKSLQEAGELLNAVSTAYKIKAEPNLEKRNTMLVDASDRLLKGANLFSIDAQNFGRSFKNVGGLAGLKMEYTDLVMMLGMMGDALNKDETAGTHAKMMIQRVELLSKSDKERLGISKEGNVRLREVIKAFKPFINDTKAMTAFFGSEVLATAAGIIGQGVETYDKIRPVIDKESAGTTKALKETFETTFSGKLKMLGSALEETQLSYAKAGVAKKLETAIDKLTELLTKLNQIPDDKKINLVDKIFNWGKWGVGVPLGIYGLLKASKFTLKTIPKITTSYNNSWVKPVINQTSDFFNPQKRSMFNQLRSNSEFLKYGRELTTIQRILQPFNSMFTSLKSIIFSIPNFFKQLPNMFTSLKSIVFSTPNFIKQLPNLSSLVGIAVMALSTIISAISGFFAALASIPALPAIAVAGVTALAYVYKDELYEAFEKVRDFVIQPRIDKKIADQQFSNEPKSLSDLISNNHSKNNRSEVESLINIFKKGSSSDFNSYIDNKRQAFEGAINIRLQGFPKDTIVSQFENALPVGLRLGVMLEE